MKKTALTGGVLLLLGSFVTFYLTFFKLAPWIVSTIPAGAWQKFLSIIVYILVGYFGGIGVPILMFCYGVFFLFVGVIDE